MRECIYFLPVIECRKCMHVSVTTLAFCFVQYPCLPSCTLSPPDFGFGALRRIMEANGLRIGFWLEAVCSGVGFLDSKTSRRAPMQCGQRDGASLFCLFVYISLFVPLPPRYWIGGRRWRSAAWDWRDYQSSRCWAMFHWPRLCRKRRGRELWEGGTATVWWQKQAENHRN
ncbi:hypothetical protein CH063_02162 [Colletotrichum higginsianum]|uniref:Uncharacterized protein n=1 Tax=Colletotrichum higginsianum (strain IMI 349063) TaxID=759273 RepID=H1VH94_COLHI|nr:hypothetical protein CH063_02162 [Colletotrichum higginsianum]